MQAVSEVELRFSCQADDDAIRALLASAGLPSSDVQSGIQEFIIAVRRQAVVGSVGIEKYGTAGLLRSWAVVSTQRNLGLGSKLYEMMVEHAAAKGIDTLYLLTTSAERFFAAQGFERVDRSLAPPDLRASQEFASLCPQSAVCMRMRLGLDE